MAVTTKKTFSAANGSTKSFGPIGIELNNQDDLDVYVTLTGGTRRLSLRQSSDTTATSSHPQVNDTTGLYFPAVSVGDQLYNYSISTDNNNIVFNNNLPSGAVVSCERRTRDSSSNYTNFSGGSTIRSTDLNTAFDESNFTAQEARNKAFELENKIFGGEATSTSFITSDEIVDGTIVDADISSTAEIQVSKLKDGAARQVLQTAANGSDVEWTSNVDIPGTLDVTGATVLDSTLNVSGTITGNVTGNVTGNLTGNVTGNVSGTAGSVTGNAATATALQNARTIGGVSFDGTANINLPGVNAAGNQDTSGNAATATALETARTIGGVSFNGTGNIDLPGVNTAGNQNTSGNAATATALSGVDASTTELNTLDGFTGSTADLNEVVSGKAVVESVSASSTNAQLPTALAVDTRITQLITDIGGFVPIANETSFPASNPDPGDNAGTIVSIKALGQAFTTGSGVTTKVFTDGAGSGNDVTITGLTQSTTYPQGRGMLVETTETLHTYAFHRLTLDETGVAAAQAAIDDWDERYYGPVGSAPSTRPGGGSRVQGDLYFDTGDNQMKVWNNAASQWDDVASSASSNIVTFSPAFDNSETEFTASTVPVDAQSILISINGVIQKPNAGTSTPSEGYIKMANGKIKFASAPPTGADYFAVSLGNTVSIGTPSPNTVGTNELKDNEVTEVKLKIHAAPSGTDKFLAYTSNGMEWAVPSYLSLANDANNRVVTGTGSGLNGEANLQFDGTALGIGRAPTAGYLLDIAGTGAPAIQLQDTDGTNQYINIAHNAGESYWVSRNNTTNGSYKWYQNDGTTTSTAMSIDSSGRLLLGTTTRGHAAADEFTISNTTSAADMGMTLRSATNGQGAIYFSDGISGDAEYRGIINYNHTSDFFSIYTAAAEKVRIDSSGRVLIGTTTEGHTPADNLTIEDSADCGITIRSGTSNSGIIYFSDGTSGTAEYEGFIQYSHSSIHTMYLGAGQGTRMEIAGDGNVKINDGDLIIGTAGHGIDFSATSDATGKASELLDDYEEGSWTPTWEPSSGSFTSIAYTANVGQYVKVGKHVTCWCRIHPSSFNVGSAGGHLKLMGLPFACASGTVYDGATLNVNYYSSFSNMGDKVPTGYVANGNTHIVMQRHGGSASESMGVGDAGTANVYATVTYQT